MGEWMDGWMNGGLERFTDQWMFVCMFLFMYICMYLYVYICVCTVYVYMCIYDLILVKGENDNEFQNTKLIGRSLHQEQVTWKVRMQTCVSFYSSGIT